ncbi:MAG: TetR/AcrR family transcriptional regulator [Fimbriimonadaceae bacterium]
MVAVLSPSTEDLILDACDELMVRYGFRKMSMDDVAKKAGMSRRTIYNFFKNKEDLGLSSISRVVGQVFNEMEAIAASDAPVDDRLKDVLEQRVLGRLRRVRDYASSLDELFEAVRPAYMGRRQAMFVAEQRLLFGLLDEGVESGVFRSGTREYASSMILATNALIPYSLSPEELGDEAEVLEKLTKMTDLLLSSVLENR